MTTTTTKTGSFIAVAAGIALSCAVIYAMAWSASKGWHKGA